MYQTFSHNNKTITNIFNHFHWYIRFFISAIKRLTIPVSFMILLNS